MLFERSSALRQIGRAVASIAIVAALAGCQARPLYSSAGGVPVKMAAIKINPLGDRVGQEVRNRLVFLTGGGAGEPVRDRIAGADCVSGASGSGMPIPLKKHVAR